MDWGRAGAVPERDRVTEGVKYCGHIEAELPLPSESRCGVGCGESGGEGRGLGHAVGSAAEAWCLRGTAEGTADREGQGLNCGDPAGRGRACGAVVVLTKPRRGHWLEPRFP